MSKICDHKKTPNEKKIKFKAKHSVKHLKLKSSNYSTDMRIWNYNVDNDICYYGNCFTRNNK